MANKEELRLQGLFSETVTNNGITDLSELDEETMSMVLSKVTEYIRESGASLLVVEHDISRAKSMADRLLVIDDGRINPFIREVTAMEVSI